MKHGPRTMPCFALLLCGCSGANHGPLSRHTNPVNTTVNTASASSAIPGRSDGSNSGVSDPGLTEAVDPKPAQRCATDHVPSGLSRIFRVELYGSERLKVEPWPMQTPPPAKFSDLDGWAKSWNDRQEPRPDQPYTLDIRGEVTLGEFGAVLDIFASRGFVRSIVSIDEKDREIYSAYVPKAAKGAVSAPFASLNLVIEANRIFVTSLLANDQWHHTVVQDQSFQLPELYQGCSGAMAASLEKICGDPLRPCQRVGLIGLDVARVTPFLEAIALLTSVSREAPTVFVSTTVREGMAPRHRSTVNHDFLDLEGLIDHGDGTDSHP